MMVAPTRWKIPEYPRTDFTPKLPQHSPLPADSDRMPIVGWLAVGLLIEAVGVATGFAMRIGWKLAEWMF